MSNSITGSAVFRGGGGGAGLQPSLGSGGVGGVGGGATYSNDGAANTGGGGSGGYAGVTNGRSGGSGVIIIRYPDTFPTASTLTVGTLTTSGGYHIYTFNASGTIGWS